jgi:ATP-binding cassette subfamily B protein/subfamily B ATP-binding cassette protein MsbA
MHNFFRALKFAWPHRGRFFLSLGCALMVAVLWGANFTSIYPFLKLLNEQKTPQQWTQEQLDQLDKELTKLRESTTRLQAETDRLEKLPVGRDRDKLLAQASGNLSKETENLAAAERNFLWTQKLHRFVKEYLPPDPFRVLCLIFGLVFLGVVLKGIFDFFQESLVASFVYHTIFDLRNRLYRRVLRQDMKQFAETGAANLMQRFTSDAENVGAGIRTLGGRMIVEPLKALVCIVLACTISWRLTLLFLILVPVALFFINWVGKTMRKAGRKLLNAMAGLTKVLQESIQGIQVVKAYTAERHERRRLFLGGKDFIAKGMKVVKLEAATDPIMEIFAVAAICAALLIGAYLVITGEERILNQRLMNNNARLEASSLLSLYFLLVATADPLRKLTSVFSKLQIAAAAADRIFEVMDRTPTVSQNQNGPKLARHKTSVEFRDVCFSYVPSRPVLKHVSFRVEHGETVAIVGKNGCGKSTLMGLFCRFYDPDYGSIFIDDTDIRGVNLRSLRNQIGYVTQNTVLFDDTIASNISYGRRHATRQEIEEAAQRAHAHEFIIKLPHGYDTLVGETGSTLSGGQRQRIALARAILRDPAVLILDEATSAADAESEQVINEALDDFAQDRTTFLITHRLSSLKIADRIVVLNQGAIEAIGTHEQLLCTCETYQRLQDAFSQRWAA